MTDVPVYLQLPTKIKVTREDLIPNRAFPSDAGADLVAKDTVWLQPFKRTLVPTGVHVEIPIGYVGLLFPRSSLSKQNIVMTNSVGVIDADYRGEIMASLMYIGNNESGEHVLQRERIVQLVMVPIILPRFVTVDELSETERGKGGFGSTGK